MADTRSYFEAADEPITVWSPLGNVGTLGDVIATLWGLGRTNEATALASDMAAAAEPTTNPAVAATTHTVVGMAYANTDPLRAMEAFRRALEISRDSGNRWNEVTSASQLSALEAKHGDLHRALDLFAAAIDGYHDTGGIEQARAPMARLAVLLHRVGRYEPAAVIAGYTEGRTTRIAVPELATTCDDLRSQLGPDLYITLTEQGAAMTPGDALRYTLEQIEILRPEL